jgi:predicted polyphosphate/ATP-dependent NAD kinase
VKRIGFVVNPIAGMGGRVGLKGTDGPEAVRSALELGAEKVSPVIALKILRLIDAKNVSFYTSSGEMGEEELRSAGIEDFEIVHKSGESTTSEDTQEACRKFLEIQVDLVLFCGGDGTARDVYDVIKTKIPMLGIPSGVKMHSAVFATDPERAAQLVTLFAQGAQVPTREAEIVDIDEEKYRAGVLEINVFGIAHTLDHELVQVGKEVVEGDFEDDVKVSIAKHLVEEMGDEVYIVGPGTTTKTIFEALGLEKTLLGVDVIKDKKVLKLDANEKNILDIMVQHKTCKIIVSPIGAQGFLFGRGNQQISCDVIRKVGIDNIIIISTPRKMANIPSLKVDTGDRELDDGIRGFRRVITGYREFTLKRVE